MLKVNQIATQVSSPYAMPADFCRLFAREMNHFYLLAYLLTANQAQAESCFVQGLEDAANSNRVFSEWAERWARRMIIQNAIQIAHPNQAVGRPSSAGSSVQVASAALEVITQLPALERFVFVMSVLERYSDQDCSLLLDCTRGDVVAARTRALQLVASSEQFAGEALKLEGNRVHVPSTAKRNATAKLAYA